MMMMMMMMMNTVALDMEVEVAIIANALEVVAVAVVAMVVLIMKIVAAMEVKIVAAEANLVLILDAKTERLVVAQRVAQGIADVPHRCVALTIPLGAIPRVHAAPVGHQRNAVYLDLPRFAVQVAMIAHVPAVVTMASVT
jgi:hypothetical protein